ncbi:MAG: peptidase domain protein [Symbiobacteriaceae bacterium]|jgi:Tfp pilus assembly protein PilV|nr:peptidase domain protein [Symbiobacteriaceae bacterium]
MAELFATYANTSPGFAAGVGFLLGLVFGSFSSVLAYRLPRGESIVSPRSSCPHCQRVLGPADLVPVLSYIWLRGRCRHCGASIAWRYPVLELICGVLGLGGALVGGMGGGMAAVTAWAVGHSAYGVLKHRKLLTNQSGMTLVEVLAAGLLLATAAASVLSFLQAGMRAEVTNRQRAHMTGVARKWYSDTANRARAGSLTPTVNSQLEGQYIVVVTTGPNSRNGSTGGSAIPIWDVTVEVCVSPVNPTPPLTCTSASKPVTLRGVVTSGP